MHVIDVTKPDLADILGAGCHEILIDELSLDGSQGQLNALLKLISHVGVMRVLNPSVGLSCPTGLRIEVVPFHVSLGGWLL